MIRIEETDDLLALDIQWMPTSRLLPQALAIACTCGITAYDACYVAFAHERQLPLLTADVKLTRLLLTTSYTVITLDALFAEPEPATASPDYSR